MSSTEKHVKYSSGIAPDCHSCILDQARSTAHLAGLTKGQTKRVMAEARTWLERSEELPLLSQHVMRYIADAVIRERGESPYFDIYAQVKEKSNIVSLNHREMLQQKNR
jgi:damage-control phosphatase, subfamily I